MAQSIEVHETQLRFAADNASEAVEHAGIEGPAAVRLTFLSPTVVLGFSLILFFVIAKAFGLGKKQKLPPGVKRLPRLPGTTRVVFPARVDLSLMPAQVFPTQVAFGTFQRLVSRQHGTLAIFTRRWARFTSGR